MTFRSPSAFRPHNLDDVTPTLSVAVAVIVTLPDTVPRSPEW